MSASSLSSNVTPRKVDVLITGGGPSGLLITYVLLKAGLNVLTVEQYDKTEQATYGRACVLYARSLEILDQLGLYDSIAEVGYIIRSAVTYKGREELDTRGWTFIQKVVEGKTYFDYSFGIRQKMSEAAFRNAIHELDSNALVAPAKLVDFSVDSDAENPVLAKIEIDGNVTEVRSKYIVGADGGRSSVRSLAKILFPGTASKFRWIRLDAIVRTDMPSERWGGVSVESPTHGNVLYTPTDNGRTRIGFICPDELYGENGGSIDANAVMAEAKKALQPFSLEFVHLDWWTVYAIGQRVAERFRRGPILLAGDAGHTHSSGAAQGMNTGVHDASNLSWKLAGVLKGWYTEDILDTYDTERRASAHQLIQLDKDISSLISGVIPEHFNAPPDADVHAYLDKVFTSSANFTVGLGISYEANLINQKNESTEPAITSLSVQIGHRAPDALLFRPGSKFPKRLQELTPNRGKFWILVFAGGLDPSSKQPRLRQNCVEQLAALHSYIDGPSSFVRGYAPVFEFLTIVRGQNIWQTAETLDGQPLGKAVYDHTGDVYGLYGVDETVGTIIILRPDGIVAFVASMNQHEVLGRYFARFVKTTGESRDIKEESKVQQVTKIAMGEISLEGQDEETQLTNT